jgi:hypothetical protein
MHVAVRLLDSNRILRCGLIVNLRLIYFGYGRLVQYVQTNRELTEAE